MQTTNFCAEINAEIKKSKIISSSWEQYLILEEPPEVQPLIQFGNAPIATPYNHSLVIGKKKSRKSLYVVHLLGQYVGDHDKDVLIVDTEQGKRHVWQTRERVFRLTGKHVHTLSLRGLGPKERREIIDSAIAAIHPKIIVIDGIRDLLADINSPQEATDLLTWIEAITVRGPHVINVLHTNKNDSNARGHLGTELVNKAELTTTIEIDAKSGFSVAICESSRDISFSEFAFTHGTDGLPKIVSEVLQHGNILSNDEQKNRLKHVFDGQQLAYKDLIDAIKGHFSVGRNAAVSLVCGFTRQGWIMKNGTDRAKDTRYKLML